MKLLLDTCTFLWLLDETDRLSERCAEVFRDPANEVYLSSVSVWEIAVKHALGKLTLYDSPRRVVPEERSRHGIEALALDESSALMLDKLPALHRDPFDRMLICQALVGGFTILTPDPAIGQYPVATLW